MIRYCLIRLIWYVFKGAISTAGWLGKLSPEEFMECLLTPVEPPSMKRNDGSHRIRLKRNFFSDKEINAYANGMATYEWQMLYKTILAVKVLTIHWFELVKMALLTRIKNIIGRIDIRVSMITSRNPAVGENVRVKVWNFQIWYPTFIRTCILLFTISGIVTSFWVSRFR